MTYNGLYTVRLALLEGPHYPDTFKTLQAAVSFARSKGYTCTLYHINDVIGEWSPLYGVTLLPGQKRHWRQLN